MSTAVIETTNKVLTDGTQIFSSTAVGDFYWLTQGVLATQSNGLAVSSSYGDFSAQIDGQLFGSIRAIALFGDGDTVSVGATGKVLSQGSSATSAIGMLFTNQLVDNAGTISSLMDIGIQSTKDHNGITNSGSIFGGRCAVSLENGASNVLINTGTITSGTGGSTVMSASAVVILGLLDRVINSGTISATAAEGAGICLGYTLSGAAGSTIKNLANGVIQSAEAWGVDANPLTFGTFSLINRGHIEGADGSVRGGTAGMTLRNFGSLGGDVDLGLGTVTFENHGMVDGNVTEAGAQTTLRNFGTITGDVSLGAGADLFVNRGTVEGDVRLGSGGGTYNGAAGHVLGTIYGGRGAALIIGSADDDVIDASGFVARSAKGDELRGGAGSDLIIAGNGRDLLIGGAGADTFKFLSSFAVGATAATSDTIKDFAHGVDDIDLSAFMAKGKFIGAGPFTGHSTSEVSYAAATGLISGDVNGDGTADWTLHVKAQTVLTAADFIF